VPAITTSEQYDALWSLTARAKKKRLTDNISDSYPTIAAFRKAGILETYNGGKQIQEDLMYELADSEWFDGYDQLSSNSMDGITSCFEYFRYNATPIVISMTEEMENRSSDKAVKLLTAKTEQAMTGSMSTINAALLSAQSGKSIVGLQDICSETAGGTVHSVNSATNTWWDNKRVDYDSSAGANDFNAKTGDIYYGVRAMRDLWNKVSESNDTPNLLVTNFSVYGDYQSIFEGTGYYRFSSTTNQALGDSENNATFRGAEMIVDRDSPGTVDNHNLYMLQTKYLKLKMQEGLNFAKTPFKEPVSQQAKISYVITSLQLMTNNRRRQGVLYNIETSSTI
tara:strand:- start:14661 stop:15677 length:1017 start_codon:yes stop_codon:yes gene_type:complete